MKVDSLNPNPPPGELEGAPSSLISAFSVISKRSERFSDKPSASIAFSPYGRRTRFLALLGFRIQCHLERSERSLAFARDDTERDDTERDDTEKGI